MHNLKEAGVDATDEQAEEVRQTFINQDYELDFGNEDYFLGIALQMSQELYPYVATKDIHLVKAPSTNFFVTSDDPVTIHAASNIHPMRAAGFQNGIILFPISPKFCLVLKNKKSPKPPKITPHDIVDEMNEHTAANTHMYVFSNIKSDEIRDMLNKSNEDDQGSAVLTWGNERRIYKPPKPKKKNKKHGTS
jgi:hypothetical protein